MELVDVYRSGVSRFRELVRQVGPDQWSAPTPCTEWDVRALVNHLVYEERWTAPMMAGATIAEVGDRFEGDLLGDDPVGSVAGAAAEADTAIAEPGALGRTVHLSFGDTPAEEYVWQLTADHLIHSWDLAVAIGADAGLPPDALAALAGWFVDREEMYRKAGAIGPRGALPPDASDQDRLVAAFGRDPRWSPGSP